LEGGSFFRQGRDGHLWTVEMTNGSRYNEIISGESSMSRTTGHNNTLKQTLKQALTETLQEQRGLLGEVFSEVLEDFALATAIRQGQKSPIAKRSDILRVLQGKR
jgi:hypothetical protein